MDAFEPNENQRAIYSYSDGKKKVFADPLFLRAQLKMLALQLAGKDISKIIDTANKTDLKGASEIELSEAYGALMALAEISTQAFGLVPFNPDTGEGATKAHAIGVVNHFYLWLQKKNQRPVSRPTSTPHSASISETQPTTATSSV